MTNFLPLSLCEENYENGLSQFHGKLMVFYSSLIILKIDSNKVKLQILFRILWALI